EQVGVLLSEVPQARSHDLAEAQWEFERRVVQDTTDEAGRGVATVLHRAFEATSDVLRAASGVDRSHDGRERPVARAPAQGGKLCQERVEVVTNWHSLEGQQRVGADAKRIPLAEELEQRTHRRGVVDGTQLWPQ